MARLRRIYGLSNSTVQSGSDAEGERVYEPIKQLVCYLQLQDGDKRVWPENRLLLISQWSESFTYI